MPNRPTMRSTLANTAILAGIQALGILTAPGVERGSFEGFSVNTASESDPWRLLAGTNRITPSLIWYGDKAVERVRNGDFIKQAALNGGLGGLAGYAAGGGNFGFAPDPPSAIIGLAEGTGFGIMNAGLSALRTFSWRYHMGRAYSIGHGRLHAITEILDGDTVVATGEAANVGGTLVINKPELYGGDHKEGGFVFIADIIPGERWPIQQPNPYLVSQLGNIPALDGKSAIVLRGPSGGTVDDLPSGYFFAGFQGAPPIKPFSITTQQFYNLLGVPQFSTIRDKDANPVEFLYDWMTARTRGFGYGCDVPLEDFDYDNWRTCAEIVFDEGLGYSADHKNNISRWQMCEDLCSFIGCFIYEHPVTGLITMKLVRPDYDVEDLPVFDASNIESVEGYDPAVYSECPNEIRITYIDRDNNHKERTSITQNDAVRRLIGDVIPKSIDYPGIGCKETAGIISARELASSFPRSPLKLNVIDDAQGVKIGDAIVWSYPKYRVQQMVLRVLGVKESDTQTNKVTLNCSIDVYGRGNIVTAFPSDTIWQPEKFHFNYGNFDIPMFQLNGTAEVADVAGFGDWNIPMFQISGSANVTVGASGSWTIPMFQLSGSATVSDTGDLLTEDGDNILTEDGDRLRQE
jgi:hypothetical protein